MKYSIWTICLLLGMASPAFSQTRVEKKIAMKSNGYGVTYSLPKTSLVVTAEITQVTCKAGPYYKYAEKYLGLKDAVMSDHVYYELSKVYLQNKGVPDEANTYIVEFKPKTTAPFVYLTDDGLLCTINADYSPTESVVAVAKRSAQAAEKEQVPALMTEELLMAGSVTRQAEVAARQIYKLRETRMDILSGEADNMPPDGEAMKIVLQQLTDQEQALTALFVGEKHRKTTFHETRIVPDDDLDREVLFRFSEKLGLLDPDDLGGTPIYLSLHAINRAPALDPKEAEKKEKSMKGIIYNVPGKADARIEMGDKQLYRGEVQVVQFGSHEALAPVMFEDRKAPIKVIFYPETGAIKQIIQ